MAISLAQEGATVLAGLALGIDTAAHLAALEAGGQTVAVIGTGINKTYPSANRELLGVIAKEGLLFSQFWPDAPPPQSSARARARMAVAHGRPVILTDLVVERNDWAKALVNRPGVHVATASGAHHLDASTSTRVRRTSTNDVVALDVERCWHAVASRGVQVAGTGEVAERRQSW